jgi:alcohol dehydrogenase class IV
MSGMVFDKAHVFYSPNKVIFGPNTIRVLANEVVQLGGKRALIVTDEGVVRANLIEPVKAALESAKVPYAIYDKVKPEPPVSCVEEAFHLLKSEKCDIIIGIGGGSSMDVAKIVALRATNEMSVLEMCGFDLVKKRGLPKILVPTTSGTGSEATRVSVLIDEKQNVKTLINSLFTLADVAIVDPLMTLTAPPKVTADTGVDALVHAIETYVATTATPFSDILAERAIEWIAQYLPVAWAKGSNLEARYYMSLASTLAGMAFASGGLGAVHALAYPIGTEFHLSHGRSNAIMLPHVMKYNLAGNPDKYGMIANLMEQDVEGLSSMEAAELSVEAVQGLLSTVNISYRLRDYGISKEAIRRLIEGGMRYTRLFIPNPRDLTEEDVRSVYEDAY